MEFKFDFFPQEITEALLDIAQIDDCNCAKELIRDDVICALYDIKATCENKYNADYWRVLWRVLESIVHTHNINKHE